LALPEEPSNLILKGFAWLLSTTLQVLGVVGLHVCALEVVHEDLLEILLDINRVSHQVVQLGLSHVGQVNGDELDDEEVIIYPACPTRKAVVLQPNVGVCLAVIFDDVVRCAKMFWETCVMHVAPKRLGPWLLRAEATPLLVITPTATWVTCEVFRVCALVPLVGLMVHQGLKVPICMA
jgi:hypothetical protein